MPEDSPNPTIAPSPGRSTAPRPAVKVHKGNFATRLFGYDIFLSFALGPPPRGTVSYASDLARRLAERDYSVFFSEEEAPPGDRLDTALQRALLRSNVLMVVANRDVLREPRWVRKEVDEFRRHHPNRPVVTVNVDGALQDPAVAVGSHEWLVDPTTIWVDESAEAVTAGIASHHVVERLATAPARVRSNVKWRQIVGLVIIALAALGIGLGLTARVASKNAEEARAQQRRAEERASIALSRQLAYQGTSLLPWNQVRGENSDAFQAGTLFEGLAIVAQAVRVASTNESYDAALRAVAWMRSSLPPVHFLSAADGPVSNVAFTEEGRALLRASSGTQIDYWRLHPSGADLHSSKTIKANFDRITFSQDGRLAALLSAHKKVELLDVNSGAIVPVRDSASGEVIAFTFTPDGTWLLIAELAGVTEPGRKKSPLTRKQLLLTAWNVVTRQSTTSLVTPPDLAVERLHDTVMAAFPDNRALIMSSPRASDLEVIRFGVGVIDWRTGSTFRRLELDCARVTSVDISPDGRFIAAGCADWGGSSGRPSGTLAIWAAGGENVPARMTFEDTGAPVALEFFPDSTTLGATYDGTLVVFDVSALRAERQNFASLKDLWLAQRYSPNELPDHVRLVIPGIGAERVVVSPEEDIAVFDARHVALVRVPHTGSGAHYTEELRVAPQGARTLALTSDGQKSAFIDDDEPRTIGLWNVPNSRLLQRLQLPSNSYVQEDALYAFSGDGTKFVVLQKDGTAWSFNIDTVESGETPAKLSTPRQRPSALALNRDGSAVILGYEDGTILIWELTSRKAAHVFAKESGVIEYLAADPSGLLLASVSHTDRELAVRFWDLTTGRRISQGPRIGTIFSIAFSPDRNRAALAMFKDAIVLLDVQSGRQIGETTRRDDVGRSTHLAFGPDGISLIVDHAGRAEKLDPLMAVCNVLNNELGGRRWAELVEDGFEYQPACVRRPTYMEWHSQENPTSTEPFATTASPITGRHERAPPTSTAREPERSARADAEDTTNWNGKWFMQFNEMSRDAACLRANEPDLRNAIVLRCDDFYGGGTFLVRLGPTEDRAELNLVRRKYLDKGVFSVMLRYEACSMRPRRVECP